MAKKKQAKVKSGSKKKKTNVAPRKKTVKKAIKKPVKRIVKKKTAKKKVSGRKKSVPKVKKIKRLTKRELKEFKKILLELKEEIAGEIDHINKEARSKNQGRESCNTDQRRAC